MKDALGHGSDAGRGGSYSNIERNARGPGKHVGYADGPWHVQKSNGPKSNWFTAVNQRTGDVVSGQGLRAISEKLASRGNMTPQAAANTMHSTQAVSGTRDSTYRGYIPSKPAGPGGDKVKP